MKVFIYAILVLVCIFGVTNGQNECPQICPLNYAPVCGFNGDCYKEFSNKCGLDAANCGNRGASYRAVDLASCQNASKKC